MSSSAMIMESSEDDYIEEDYESSESEDDYESNESEEDYESSESEEYYESNESEEDYESNESEGDCESYESDKERGFNQFGGTTRAYENGESTLPKKERIKRKGRVPLNLTRNYGRKSGWGERQGFRELIQNLYIPNIRSG
jgi:hypothetical protein